MRRIAGIFASLKDETTRTRPSPTLCGIAGFTTKNWSPGRERIQSATDTLIHRGPDQQGVFRSHGCSLGATRLKIVDLAHGDQPIYSEDGDSVIVFNGEIYNHLEVRRELESLGHRFQTHCDTETVLQAFLEWDTDCFVRLRGMFAAAIWSESRQRLVIVRDRVGIKPLYVAERGEDLLFASELKGILVHPEVERRLSLNGLDCYLSMNYVPSPWTLIEGVEKLPAGHWLEWQDGRTCKEAYWTIPEIKPSAISLEDAKSELGFLLDQSVREHMMSEVPLGVWLSGGIDSSTILHYAAQATSRLRTFSICFSGHSFDESSYIHQVVKHYGTEHEERDLNPAQNLAGAIDELPYYSDEPSADSGALPVWFLSKLCKSQCTVAFSGEGADELFGGYLTYRANRIAAQIKHLPGAAIRLALEGLRLWPASNEKISLEYKVKRLLQGSLMTPQRAHVYWNGTFSETEKAALLRVPLPQTLTRGILARLAASLPGDGIAPFMEFDQEYYLADDILVKSDRMSMAHAVEVRPPFLDHRIIEFAARLPAQFKIKGSRQKVVLKDLMLSKLPVAVIQRSKTGFDIPAHEWFRGPLQSMLLETLEAAEAEHSDVFDFAVIRRYAQLHLDRRINVGYHLWGLLMLFLWMKRWKIQSSPSPIASTISNYAKPGSQVLAVER